MRDKPWYRRLTFGHSRVGRLIFGLNLLGLLVLIIGALALNEWRQGLIRTQQESLTSQARLMGEVIAIAASGDGPEAHLQVRNALEVLSGFTPQGERARLFDARGEVLSDGVWRADSLISADTVEVKPLPPARKADEPAPKEDTAMAARLRERAQDELRAEVAVALGGTEFAAVRHDEYGGKVVSVSVPLRRVDTVLGVLTIERGDADKIVEAQRMAMVPFILVALAVTLVSSILIHWLVTRPIQRLSAAADNVRLAQTRAISLPDLESRRDEIGTLARSLESMTATLWRRMEEIDRFAADVSHEIKNPLTSIRSALETLLIVKDDGAKVRLMNVIQQDVRRLDRLITDISNASRLDAELARDQPRRVEIGSLLDDIIALYQQSQKPDEPSVAFTRDLGVESSFVSGREGPLGQVFRNVIDNARSFSPPDGVVRVTLAASGDPARPLLIRFDDDGPGIPEENLETIFQRFYTSRPRGTSFGRNSGLGLSISRQIIEAHHGRIWAENRHDDQGRITGARFSILMPAGA